MVCVVIGVFVFALIAGGISMGVYHLLLAKGAVHSVAWAVVTFFVSFIAMLTVILIFLSNYRFER